MNYIHTLEKKVRQLRAQSNDYHHHILAFMSFLNTDKFYGHEADGSRKDWISTGDAQQWLRDILNSADATYQEFETNAATVNVDAGKGQ